jgi:flagellar basal-body rod protein FlgG
MDRGIYAASSGGFLATKQLDVIANNLANVNTVGFKAERLITRKQEFGDTLASVNAADAGRSGDFDRTPGVIVVGSMTDFSQGPIQTTGDPLHVALTKNNQFFIVETPEGEMLTRAGNFGLNGEGQLVTADGFPVAGAGGPIVLPAGKPKISPNGTIDVNGRIVGKLRVVEVEDLSTLNRQGSTRFRPTGGALEDIENVTLAPESVEMPNVEVVEGMVNMITASRAFEAYTKTTRTIDELNERAIRTARTTG